VLVFIAPVLLGDGTRLFAFPGGAKIGLDRMSQSEAPPAAGVWYRIAR